MGGRATRCLAASAAVAQGSAGTAINADLIGALNADQVAHDRIFSLASFPEASAEKRTRNTRMIREAIAAIEHALVRKRKARHVYRSKPRASSG